MAMISIYLDEQTHRALLLVSHRTGRTVEELAEAAVSNEASKTREWIEVMPPPPPRLGAVRA